MTTGVMNQNHWTASCPGATIKPLSDMAKALELGLAPPSHHAWPMELRATMSISTTRKGPVHIPHWKGAMQKAWIRAPYQKRPKNMPGARLPQIAYLDSNLAFCMKHRLFYLII